jgi:phage shock protein C
VSERESEPADPTPPGPDPAAAAPAADPAAARVLRRSRDDRVLGGVSAGLGRYFGIDPVLVRIAFVLLLFAGGTGFLLYVVAWIVIPEEAAGDVVGPEPTRTVPAAGTELMGLVLVVVGGFLLLRIVLPDIFSGRYIWPIALIVLGVALLLRGTRR